jgi:hypothetical protein
MNVRKKLKKIIPQYLRRGLIRGVGGKGWMCL